MLGIRKIGPVSIDLWLGDLTKFACDVMVNAANSELKGGGGVDGALHRAAGPELLAACAKIGKCPPGEAVVTPAFALPAKWVIHTVGPIWQDGKHDEAKILAQAYASSLREAGRLNLRHVAFSAISTGAYGFPLPAACDIAIQSLQDFFAKDSQEAKALRRVTLVAFDETLYHILQSSLFRLIHATA